MDWAPQLFLCKTSCQSGTKSFNEASLSVTSYGMGVLHMVWGRPGESTNDIAKPESRDLASLGDGHMITYRTTWHKCLARNLGGLISLTLIARWSDLVIENHPQSCDFPDFPSGVSVLLCCLHIFPESSTSPTSCDAPRSCRQRYLPTSSLLSAPLPSTSATLNILRTFEDLWGIHRRII